MRQHVYLTDDVYLKHFLQFFELLQKKLMIQNGLPQKHDVQNKKRMHKIKQTIKNYKTINNIIILF